jgi:hypothetical protein
MCLLSQIEGQEDKLKLIPTLEPYIGGKGALVHKYAISMGAKLYFSHYQSAWVGFKTN